MNLHFCLPGALERDYYMEVTRSILLCKINFTTNNLNREITFTSYIYCCYTPKINNYLVKALKFQYNFNVNALL